MAGLIDRLDCIAREHELWVERGRAELTDPRKNCFGTASNMLAMTLELIAVAAYALDRDVQRCRSLLRESALLVETLYDRFDSGEPIDESYVSLMGYKSLFDALASGDLALAVRFASKLGGRPKIERKYDHPFTRAIGSALKHVILESDPEARIAVAAFAEKCGAKGNTAYAGYATSMQAILDRDAAILSAGIKSVLSSHKGLCSRGRMFDLTADEVICKWALGLVNLAVSRGLAVQVDHPYLPGPLIAT